MLETWGNPDRCVTGRARLQNWRDSPYTQLRLFFVRVDGLMVGRSWIRFGLQENVRTALLHVNVLAEFSGRGIGRALLDHAEELAAVRGCTTLQTFTEHPADFDVEDPRRLKPAHGHRRGAGRGTGRPFRRCRRATGWNRWNASAPWRCRPPKTPCRP